MKKYLFMILCMCLMCMFIASCSNKEAPQPNSDVINTENSAVVSATVVDSVKTPEIPAANDGVDVDLTVLSKTIAFAELINMQKNPEDYLGKIIKIRGSYYAAYSEKIGAYRNNIIVSDASYCCEQGMRFLWTGEHSYPEDYPYDNASIELIGEFVYEEEPDFTYYCLSVDDISVLL